jgi:hypothetical protein
MDEQDRPTPRVAGLNQVELDASTAGDFVTLHHLPRLTLLPVIGYF